MAQGKKRRSHRSSGAAAGLTGPPTVSSLHSVDTHPPTRHDSASIWSRRRVLLLNSTYEPLTALPMRRAIVMVICGKADVVHARPGRAGHPLGDQLDRGAVGHPAADLRPGSVSRPGADDPRRAHAPRPFLLCLLRGQGRHRRSRGAPQPRRRPLLGELRRVLFDLQPPQGRQTARRTRLGIAPGARPADGTALAAAVDGQGNGSGLGSVPRRRRGLTHNTCVRERASAGTRWDTVCVVSEMQIHLVSVGIPALLVLVLVALI